jgi:hypothetical protein
MRSILHDSSAVPYNIRTPSWHWNRTSGSPKWSPGTPVGILAICLFIFIGGRVVEQLWNWLLPSLFGWRQVTFWQERATPALCRILFDGLGGHGGHRSRFRRRMQERWEAMTPGERERFRQGMRARCGFGPSARESQSQAASVYRKRQTIRRGDGNFRTDYLVRAAQAAGVSPASF